MMASTLPLTVEPRLVWAVVLRQPGHGFSLILAALALYLPAAPLTESFSQKFRSKLWFLKIESKFLMWHLSTFEMSFERFLCAASSHLRKSWLLGMFPASSPPMGLDPSQ